MSLCKTEKIFFAENILSFKDVAYPQEGARPFSLSLIPPWYDGLPVDNRS